MSQYRSALGKSVDMSRIASKNEHVRAVGNMKVNARGDTIDSLNRVVEPVTKRAGDNYQRSVSTRASNLLKRENQSPSADIVEPLTKEEQELDLDDDIDFEALKKDEVQIKPASEAPDFVKPETTKKK